jgi:hypothetical protein
MRAGAALAVIAAGAWLFLMMREERPQNIGRGLFYVLTGGATLFALVSGVRLTSDCLSEEKRGGTLGLLFLTDLRGYDIILGKLSATSFSAVYNVLAIVPVLAIPLLMGGVTAGEFGRLSLVALDTMFLSLSAGLLVSALSRSAQRANVGTVALVLGVAVLPLVGFALSQLLRWPKISPGFLLPSPGYAYYQGLAMVYKPQEYEFWYSLAVIHGLSWILLAAASRIVPHTWQDRPASSSTLTWSQRMQLWWDGGAAGRAAFRRLLLDHNPIDWLAGRTRWREAALWLFLAATALAWFAGLAKYRRDWLDQSIYVITGLFLSLVLRTWFANEATRHLAEERKAGTLELILSTPLSVPEILEGERRALQRQFVGPVAATLAIQGLLLWATIRQAEPGQARLVWFCFWVAVMLMFVADLLALFWVCLWQALTARNVSRAASNAVSRILFVPWGLLALILLVATLSPAGRGRSGGADEWKLFLGLWFALGLAADFGFASYARQQLLTEFRRVAQERYAPPSTWWQRLWKSPGDSAS